MPPRKRQRNNEPCSALPPLPTLPVDLLLEIAARSDATTIIHCAAACRLLRGRILTAAFTQQQVYAGVLPSWCVLARLHARRLGSRKPLVSLVYPATPAASSLVRKRLAPFVSRQAGAAGLLRTYEPVTSRRGLVVLRLRHRKRCMRSDSDLCVYDPMTDARTFISGPPNVSMNCGIASDTSCVLLTAADGIACCSFLLLVANMNIHLTESTLRVQTSSPADAAAGEISWGPVTKSVCPSGSFQGDRGLAVLPGGVIHWITRDQKILRYDVRTGTSGTVKLPHMPGEQHLAMSPDGKLRIYAVQEFMISVWEQLSAGNWSQGATIDTEEKLRSMHPKTFIHGVELRCSDEIRSNAVLLQINDQITVLLDLETKEMRELEDSTSPIFFEIDLLTRLQAMRIFS